MLDGYGGDEDSLLEVEEDMVMGSISTEDDPGSHLLHHVQAYYDGTSHQTSDLQACHSSAC